MWPKQSSQKKRTKMQKTLKEKRAQKSCKHALTLKEKVQQSFTFTFQMLNTPTTTVRRILWIVEFNLRFEQILRSIILNFNIWHSNILPPRCNSVKGSQKIISVLGLVSPTNHEENLDLEGRERGRDLWRRKVNEAFAQMWDSHCALLGSEVRWYTPTSLLVRGTAIQHQDLETHFQNLLGWGQMIYIYWRACLQGEQQFRIKIWGHKFLVRR